MSYDIIDSVFDEDYEVPFEEECDHGDLIVCNDGSGYCRDCGMPFSAVSNIGTSGSNKDCPHSETYENSSGISLCSKCGSEVDILDTRPEWRFYGGNDNQSCKDPSRCHQPRKSSKNLDETFRKLKIQLPQAMRDAVEDKYYTVVSRQKQNRSTEKEALMAVCLFYVYREYGEKRSAEHVRKQFKNVSKKKMSKAFASYFAVYDEISFRPNDLLKWTLKQIGLYTRKGSEYNFEPHHSNVVAILSHLENTSKMLSRGTPQTVAAAAVYFYICLFPCVRETVGLTKSEFSRKVKMSDITISKLVKEMARLTGKEIRL